MSYVAQVQNGQFVESASQSSLSKATEATNSGMDKDAFLQLLVAQMKYQDPLQPTSNTEYISQYAQFSQVEQMQNMASSMDLQRASGLVGQYVFVNTTNASGVTKEIEGKVDYVVYENNKAYLAINEQLYSLDDLVSVADQSYIEAFNKAFNFVAQINQLPNVNSIDLTDVSDIEELESIYDGMSDYEKSFVASDIVKILNQYIDKVEELKLQEEQANKVNGTGNTDGTEGTEGTENPEGTENTEGTEGSGAAES